MYQKKSNKEYIIVNNKNTAKVTSMLIPGLKYNYQSSDQSKLSLLSFFQKNTNINDEEKFKGYLDWIYLFTNLRNDGLYDFKSGNYNNIIANIQTHLRIILILRGKFL